MAKTITAEDRAVILARLYDADNIVRSVAHEFAAALGFDALAGKDENNGSIGFDLKTVSRAIWDVRNRVLDLRRNV